MEKVVYNKKVKIKNKIEAKI